MANTLLITLLELGIAATYVVSVFLILALLALLVLFLTSGPPQYDCEYEDCGASFPAWDLLVAHESEHRCYCGPGRHHPSCDLRRAAA